MEKERKNQTEGVWILFEGPKTDEVTGDWRKQHNDELHDLHSSQ